MSAFHQSSLLGNQDGVEWASLEASLLLESVGFTGLCHPTSNDLQPYFPLCASLFPERFLSDAELTSSLSDEEWFYLQNGILAVLCVCVAALAAGLTMGLLSLDPLLLLIKIRAGATEKEKNQAASLLPIVKQHHLLLVTLLLLNSMANEALPLFLDKIFPGYVAVIISVVGVLIFGEIIPSAIFTGPNQVTIAAHMVPVIRVVMTLLYPLAYPIAKLLDHVLHDGDNDNVENSNIYNRGELSALVRIQYEERMAGKQRRKDQRQHMMSLASSSVPCDLRASVPAQQKQDMKDSASEMSSSGQATTTVTKERRRHFGKSPSIHFDEVTMVEGALAMGIKIALDVYTPLRNLFAIPYDTILDEDNVVHIYSSGYSRIPVFDRKPTMERDYQSIRGILLTKQLIVVSAQDQRPVSTLPLQKPFCIAPTKNLVDCINLFQTGGTAGKGGHMALVCVRPKMAMDALERDMAIPEAAGVMGILTLEDVLEELLQEQIYDEMDHYEQNQLKSVQWAFRKWKVFVKKRKLRQEEDELNRTHDNTQAFLHVVADVLHNKKLLEAEYATMTHESSPLLGDENEGQGQRPSRSFGFFQANR